VKEVGLALAHVAFVLLCTLVLPLARAVCKWSALPGNDGACRIALVLVVGGRADICSIHCRGAATQDFPIWNIHAPEREG